MAFLLKAMGFSDAIPNFPFSPIEPPSSSSASSTSSSAPYRAVFDVSQRHIGCSSQYTVQMVNGITWTVRQGRATDDKRKLVSIFTCHYGTNTRAADLARNAMKRAKSLVLPGFLKVHAAADYHDTIHIATDPCVPLKAVLALPAARHFFFSSSYHTEDDSRMGVAEDTESFHEALALGLRSIGGALNSLHRNHLMHGNVCADTVFVLVGSGAWRLFGLELVSTAGEPNGLYYSTASSLLPRGRVPPEVQQGRRDLIPSLNAGHADAWGLGLLIAQAAGVSAAEASQGRLDDVEAQAGASSTFLSPTQLRDNVPKDLLSSFQDLTNQNPQSRMTLPAFLDKTALLMKSELVQTHAELEELTLRDQGQRERFFDRLNSTTARFPFRFCLCTLVGKLAESLQTGAVANVVQPIAHIASRLPSPRSTHNASTSSAASPSTSSAAVTMVENDFDVFLAPAFTLLYQSTDNLLRYRLLEHAALYAPHMPSKTASEVIWPLYMRSFTSQASSVREYSARALVHIAPKLSPSIIQKDIPQAVSTLQRDSDGTIRTNATICLCLLAPHLPEAERSTILVNGFCRMLKDPFTPSRVAALRSLASTVRYVGVAPLAQTVLPAVCPLTVDSDSGARSSALAIVQSGLERLQSADIKARQEEASHPASASTAANTSHPDASHPNDVGGLSSADSRGGAGSQAGGLMSGLTSWATAATSLATSSTPATTSPRPARAPWQPSSTSTTSSGPAGGPAAPTHAGKSGWSEDDDDDESGWGTGRAKVDDLFTSTTAQVRSSPAVPNTFSVATATGSRATGASGSSSQPVAPANADFSSLFESMTMNTSASPSSPGTTSGSAMKLRSKKGGFGATRL